MQMRVSRRRRPQRHYHPDRRLLTAIHKSSDHTNLPTSIKKDGPNGPLGEVISGILNRWCCSAWAGELREKKRAAEDVHMLMKLPLPGHAFHHKSDDEL